MEAASARFAARDRFAAFNEPAQSPLQRYIRGPPRLILRDHKGLTASVERAVDPQNFEADLALDLEIADLINTKKGNACVSCGLNEWPETHRHQAERSCCCNR